MAYEFHEQAIEPTLIIREFDRLLLHAGSSP